MIDLHTHTYCSDGADSPETLLKHAQDSGLSILSITDHNTIDAYDDPCMKDLEGLFSGTVIPGVEITCMFEGEVVEVLGYGFDLKKMKDELKEHVLSFEDKQNKEYELVLKSLKKAGAVFDPEKISFDPTKESCRKSVMKELARHPENDALFTDPESRTVSKHFTRHEIYNPDSPLYTDESPLYPTVKEAVKMIHDAGGIAFLAHLYEYANANELFPRLGEIVKKTGLDGIECRHNCFKPEDTKRLEAFCNENGLLKSGGSDYHGARKPNVKLGNIPEMQVPELYPEAWPAVRKFRGL